MQSLSGSDPKITSTNPRPHPSPQASQVPILAVSNNNNFPLTMTMIGLINFPSSLIRSNRLSLVSFHCQHGSQQRKAGIGDYLCEANSRDQVTEKIITTTTTRETTVGEKTTSETSTSTSRSTSISTKSLGSET